MNNENIKNQKIKNKLKQNQSDLFNLNLHDLTHNYPLLTAGVDEVGRGALIGPVFAAAVILNPEKPINGLTDSKKLKQIDRERLFDEICSKAIAFSIAQASRAEIDEINILQASLLAMRRAVDYLSIEPELVLVDGNQLPQLKQNAQAIIKGDLLIQAISAASILAKVQRDLWCVNYDIEYPQYGFKNHKGYGTQSHLLALKKHGICPEHRLSFSPVRAVL